MRRAGLFSALSLLPLAAVLAGEPRPVELGRVAWTRDYSAALKQAAASAKPVFLLFQEVPG